MKYTPINPELFIRNRKNFSSRLKTSSIAIFHSNDLMPKSADQHFPFHQNADLFYLSGIDQEDSILILFPDSPVPEYKEVLFIKETNEHIAIWEGEKLNRDKAKAISGIQNIYWLKEFDNVFRILMNHAQHCYLNLNENDRFSSEVPYKDLRFANELKKHYPLHHYERSAPIMAELRVVKSDIEIEVMKKACKVTEKAFRRVLEFVKPGVTEYEIEAEITHEFTRNGSKGHAYEPIIASGADSCVLHYVKNDKTCKDGDILLFDFGAEYANYASDLSRTIPVNGKYTERQKQVYNADLKVMREALKLLQPGITLNEYQKEVGKVMEAELINIGLLDKTDVKNQDPKKPLYKKYFMHGTSHFLGIDVHDIGDRYKPLQAGMVLTCEPGIYIREEGIGVRIENDVVVTDNGVIDLMKDIPIEADEIESLMNAS